jgi:type IV pilus assembly protein PilN
LIKINLLPVKRAARKSKSPADEAMMQLGIGLGVALIAVGACGYRWLALQDEVTQQTQIKTTKTKELDDLKKKVQEVEDYEKKKRILEDKNRIIEELRKKQGGPVRLLDYLSQSVDPLKVWLTKVEGDTQVRVEGKALSNDDIVQFVLNLQQSNLFSSVALQESVKEQDGNLWFYSFKLIMTVKG